MENNKFDPQAEDSFNVDFTDELNGNTDNAIDSIKERLLNTKDSLSQDLDNTIELTNNKIDSVFTDVDSASTNPAFNKTSVHDELDLTVPDMPEIKELPDTKASLSSNSPATVTESADSFTDLPMTDSNSSTLDQLDALNVHNAPDNSLQATNLPPAADLPKINDEFSSDNDFSVDLTDYSQTDTSLPPVTEQIENPNFQQPINPEPNLGLDTNLQQPTSFETDTGFNDQPHDPLVTGAFDENNDPIVAAASVTSPRGENKLRNKKKTSRTASLLKLIVFGLILAIIALVAFLFIDNNQQSSTTDTTSTEPQSTITPVEPNDKPTDTKTDSETKVNTANENPASDETATSTEIKDDDGTDVSTTEKTDTKATADNTTTTKTIGEIPDPDKIINAPIPTNETQVKEEIDRLNDQDKQLIEQEQLLDKRVQMMDELTTKKQEQIELLEKQIAQLEEQAKKGGN